MGLITGFIEGAIRTNGAGTPTLIPFQDKIEGVTFTYQTENITVETFAGSGIKGASDSCPYREMCSMELRSKNIPWGLLQFATNTLAQDGSVNATNTQTVVLSAVDATPASTFELPSAPADGTAVYAADADGVQLNVTVAGSTVTFDSDLTGQSVTIQWVSPDATTNTELALGAGTKLGEIGVYGRFFGCPDAYLVAIPRGIIEANLSLEIESDAGQATGMVKALRDPLGNYAYIKRLVNGGG